MKVIFMNFWNGLQDGLTEKDAKKPQSAAKKGF